MRARRTGARAAEERTAAVVADERALLVLDRERRLQRLGARLGALGRRAAEPLDAVGARRRDLLAPRRERRGRQRF